MSLLRPGAIKQHKQIIPRDDKSMFNLYIPTQIPKENLTVAICSHQVDSPLYLWPDVCTGDLQVYRMSLLRPGVTKEKRSKKCPPY